MKDDRLEKICKIVRTLKEEGPTMSVGAGGYTGAADPKGPGEGYDPVLGKIDSDLWSVLKTFIVFLGRVPEYPKSAIHDIQVDIECLGMLRKV